MHSYRIATLGSLLAAAVWAAAQGATPTPSPAERHAEAARSFREGRYAAAYGRVAALADAGHLPSAQLALVMHDQGRALFVADWSATPDQRRRWNALVINAARQRIDLVDNDQD